MITITTTHGEFRGRTIDSIVRREYGRSAEARRSADRNAPEWGMVVRTDEHGTHVLARIFTASDPLARDASVLADMAPAQETTTQRYIGIDR